MNDTPIVELDHISFHQHDTRILSDINWSLLAGEHWAVLGPNGSGKTTLLKIACGYLWPSNGSVLRLGQELLDLRELRRQTGWITGELPEQIPDGDTALETVVTGRFAQLGIKHFSGFKPSNSDFADARDMLVALRCEALIDKPFGVLSQGERQQVLVARARMAAPLLLVLDEPCAGMDPGVRERFLSWLDQGIRVDGSPTVVFVTHHVEEIVPGMTQTLMLKSGKIHANGPTVQVVTQQSIEQLYDTQLSSLQIVGGRLWPIWKDS